MNAKFYVIPFAMLAALLGGMPLAALAHGHSEFKIGNKIYQFVVGSLNEPVAVDDKTGVDIRISEVIGGHDEDEHRADEKAVTQPAVGLEKDLRVELAAGDKKKVLDLSPVFNTPGSYKANFIPTVQTTYAYRFFGNINGVDVSLPFACNPAGHPQTEAMTEPVEVGSGVTQLEKSGAFGCPVAKADLGFPEPAVAQIELTRKNSAVEAMAVRALGARNLGVVAIVLGLIGVAIGGAALAKSRKI